MEGSSKPFKNRGVWLFAVAYVLLQVPLLWKYFHHIFVRKSVYDFLPLLWLSLCVIFVIRWRGAVPMTKRIPFVLMSVVLLMSFLCSAVGYLYYNAWPVAVSLMGGIAVLFLYLSSFRDVKGLSGIWGILLFTVRLPDQLEFRLLSNFEGFSTKIASQVLDRANVIHLIQGDWMVIDGRELDIGGICNGYFSIIAVAAMAGLFTLIKSRNLMHSVLLILAAMVVAAGVNVLRVFLLGWVYASWGIDVGESVWMIAFQVSSFLVAYMGIISLDALVTFLLHGINLDGGKVVGEGGARVWNAIVSFNPATILDRKNHNKPNRGRKFSITCCSFGLLGLTVFEGLILKEIFASDAGSRQSMFTQKSELVIIDPDALSFTRPGWELLSVEKEERDFTSIWGQFSFIWKLKYYDSIVIMALDYPFDNWHDVRVCYANMGWKIDTISTLDAGLYAAWAASETQMKLPTGDTGFILCSHSDQLGAMVQPKPADSGLNLIFHYLNPKQWQEPFKIVTDKSQTTYYQTQAMVTTAFPLDEPTKQEIRSMYGEFREQTRKLIEEESNKK